MVRAMRAAKVMKQAMKAPKVKVVSKTAKGPAMRAAKARVAHRLRYNEVAMWHDATHSAFEALQAKAAGGPRALPAEWPPALLALLEADEDQRDHGSDDLDLI